MKKVFSIILAVLMVFSLASCGGKTPDAKELYLEAYNNTKTYAFDTDFELAMSAEGEILDYELCIDGELDENKTTKFSYSLSDKSSGMSYSGNGYFLMEDFEYYFQFMGMWIRFSLDEIEALVGQPVIDKEMLNAVSDPENFIDTFGYEFSEVTEEDGLYKFNITASDKTVEYMKNMVKEYYAADLTEEDMQIVDAALNESGMTDMIKAFSVETHIDAKEKTLVYSGCDLTQAMSDYMKKSLDSYAAEDPTMTDVEISIDKAVIDINVSDAGKIAPVSVPDDVKANSMSITDLLQVMMMGYEL